MFGVCTLSGSHKENKGNFDDEIPSLLLRLIVLLMMIGMNWKNGTSASHENHSIEFVVEAIVWESNLLEVTFWLVFVLV